jgi:predicted dehydrogenase
MIRIGVIGAGHLGKIHIKCIKELSETFLLVGIHDADESTLQKVAAEFNVTPYSSLEDLVTACDAVDIVTPTFAHFECAQFALRRFRHVFIEKPITNTIEEARSLQLLSQEAGMVVQVGHVERFNPAFQAVVPHLKNPMFIEAHRLAQFNPRGTDVPVVLDLMIHDIDLVLSVVKSNIRRIHASGVSIVSETPDITNARIEFDNGCVANLTASRISMKNMRKIRLFQRDAYVSIDMLEKTSEIVTMDAVEGEPDPFSFVLDLGARGKREIRINKPEIGPVNAIRNELDAFAQAINGSAPCPVPVEDGVRALDVALQIMEKLKTPAVQAD